MSLETLDNKKQYSLSSSVPASFPIPFAYWDVGEIHAVLTTPLGDATLVLNTDYSVSDPGESGVASGTLTRLTTWDETATRLTIYRELELTQPDDLVNGGEMDADIVEKMHDRAVAMIQQLKEIVSCIVRFPVTDTTTSADLPGAAARANKVLAFNSAGNPIAADGISSIPISGFMAPVVEAETEMAVEKALGILSAGASAALPDLDKTLLLLPSGAFARAVRTPASYNLNAIIDGGRYAWSAAVTANYPGSCSAGDVFMLDVAAANLAAGDIVQRLWDLTLGPASQYFEWTRQSIDGGATWTTWKATDPRNNLAAWVINTAIPIGTEWFQSPFDTSPATRWGGTWEDVSWEEANLARRVVGSLAGTFFAGTPARLTVSVASGVPSITITSGGSGYKDGESGTIPLIIAGGCTTQMVATATVTNGVLTAVNVTTAGAGYTSGAVAIYDGVVGHGDLVQRHYHRVAGNNGGSNANACIASATSNTDAGYSQGVREMTIESGYGSIRGGVETSGAWLPVKKFRKTGDAA